MFLWNDLYMTGRLWVDIEECDEIRILIDDMRRNFFVDDFAENAVFHRLDYNEGNPRGLPLHANDIIGRCLTPSADLSPFRKKILSAFHPIWFLIYFFIGESPQRKWQINFSIPTTIAIYMIRSYLRTPK